MHQHAFQTDAVVKKNDLLLIHMNRRTVWWYLSPCIVWFWTATFFRRKKQIGESTENKRRQKWNTGWRKYLAVWNLVLV